MLVEEVKGVMILMKICFCVCISGQFEVDNLRKDVNTIKGEIKKLKLVSLFYLVEFTGHILLFFSHS